MNDISGDILIVGGGVIGFSLAWRLAQRGAPVTLLDGGAATQPSARAPSRSGQATRAAAGMLSPFAEQPGPNPLVDLALESFRRYPAFLAELERESGLTVKAEGEGTLRVARSADEAAGLRQEFEWQSRCGLRMEWLDAAAVGSLEPALTGWPWPAAFSPQEQFLVTSRLLECLARATGAAGVKTILQAEVQAFQTAGDRVRAVQTTAGSFTASTFVLAAGAWTGTLAHRLDFALPVVPVRGQTLLLDNAVGLRHVLFAPGGLLQPRTSGRVLVGSTEENAGFDATASAGGVRRLLEFAFSVLPALASARLVAGRQGGFRPGTPDHLPILGPLPGWKNVHVATGHYRKGILLAPLTADLMTGYLLSGKLPGSMTPLLPSRFSDRAR